MTITGGPFKLGSRGPGVQAIQEMLIQLGYDEIEASGVFGEDTEAAVRELQADNDLEADGVVGYDTIELLEELLEGSDDDEDDDDYADDEDDEDDEDDDDIGGPGRVLTLGLSGKDVRVLQEVLCALEYDLPMNGVFGDETDEAVRAFQADRGLTVDGAVGERTAESLLAAYRAGWRRP
jgi:peptidoglycan hydrolase-like protein with peptidoglycan-binding domain